ncbi:secondary carrier transporter [Lithospermum erythrorhizon]|uniref:Secondary carrier transporter n=1 Tax=Lithospermum erythrorhizon TaxID=34254 RepID=A0AAV3QCR8_LITER
MEGDGDMGNTQVHLAGNGISNYVSFDIENATVEDHLYSNTETTSSSYKDYQETSIIKTKNTISVAEVLKTLFFILVWYIFSTFLTLYNKTLLGDDLGKFPAPLLMNTVHFAMQAAISNFITWFWSDRFQSTATMSWKDYFVRVVPMALGTAMDVNLSNASLVFISVTFATMCKSAAPIFLLLFAFAFRLESPSVKLLGIMVVISIGILLTVARETEFEFWGFIFVMLAAVMSGFRWSMTQILLQVAPAILFYLWLLSLNDIFPSSVFILVNLLFLCHTGAHLLLVHLGVKREAYGLKNPLTLMSYVAPVMAIATALMSLVLDPWKDFNTNNYFDSSWHVTRSCLLMIFGGTLAFFMVLTEFILVSVTSAVTVTIAGVVKEAVTILVAVLYFHDEFTFLKGVGLITIMFGVSLFNWYKYQKLQKGETNEDEKAGSSSENNAAKYVILDEMGEEEDMH